MTTPPETRYSESVAILSHAQRTWVVNEGTHTFIPILIVQEFGKAIHGRLARLVSAETGAGQDSCDGSGLHGRHEHVAQTGEDTYVVQMIVTGLGATSHEEKTLFNRK